MSKIGCIASNLCLLIWFFLDMIGTKIGGSLLVTRSYKEDGIFFVTFLIVFLCFLAKEKVGKYILTGWLFLWFVTQFYSHWWFTIFGPAEGKMKYFTETIKLVNSSTRYIPDFYHIVLHIFILIALVNMLIYCFQSKNQKEV